MKPDKARKPKKKKAKPVKPKARVKAKARRRKPDGLDVAAFRVDDLFKGRKAGSFSLKEESVDEQMQGFLAEFSEKAPGYVEQGAFIVQGKDGRWKVVVFGGTDFEDVMGKVLRVGILGLAQGAEED
jgi:hypothetical protein